LQRFDYILLSFTVSNANIVCSLYDNSQIYPIIMFSFFSST